MRLIARVCLFGMVLLLVLGCSEEKKEEAALLEQEMAGQDSALIESVDVDHAYSGESLGSISPMDVGAVPDDDDPSLLPTTAPVGDFTVQAAACTSAKYAWYLIELYRSRGYQPYTTMTQLDDVQYYRIRIGGFASLTDASVLRDELNDKYTTGAWVDHATP